MCKRIAFLTCKLCLHFYIVYAYDNVICPSDKLWTLRARSFCQSVQQYTCLIDSVKHIYKESCNGPRTEPPGDKTVVNSGNFDTKPCPPHRFQPFSFSSSQGNDCIFRKSICSDVGQVRHSNGTRRNDRECRCDYTRNFIFVSTSRKKRCSCDPTTEDCSCFMKPCGQGEILSQDYQCIKKEDFYGRFVCEEINMRNIQPTDSPVREVNKSDESDRTTIETEVWIAAISSSTLTGILILVFIVLFLNPWIPDQIVKISNICINDDTFSEKKSQSATDTNTAGNDKGTIASASQQKGNLLNDVNLEGTSKPLVDSHLPDIRSAENDIDAKKIAVDNSEANTSTVGAALGTSNTSNKSQLGGINDSTSGVKDPPNIPIIYDRNKPGSDEGSVASNSEHKNSLLNDENQESTSKPNSEVNTSTVLNEFGSSDQRKEDQLRGMNESTSGILDPSNTSIIYDRNKPGFVESSVASNFEQKTNLLKDVNHESTNKPSIECFSSDLSKGTDDDLENEQPTADKAEVNNSTAINELGSSNQRNEDQLGADQNTNIASYRIHKDKVDYYNDHPYESTLLKDLIEDKTIEIYDSTKVTTVLYTRQIDEEKVLKCLFDKYKSEYIIRKRNVNTNHAKVMNELRKWAGGTIDLFKEWIGYKDIEPAEHESKY